jgi:hypothetical protein
MNCKPACASAPAPVKTSYATGYSALELRLKERTGFKPAFPKRGGRSQDSITAPLIPNKQTNTAAVTRAAKLYATAPLIPAAAGRFPISAPAPEGKRDYNIFQANYFKQTKVQTSAPTAIAFEPFEKAGRSAFRLARTNESRAVSREFCRAKDMASLYGNRTVSK